MTDEHAPRRRFLEAEPTREQLWRALRRNMAAWSARWARAAGGEIQRVRGAQWTHTSLDEGHGDISVFSAADLRASGQVDATIDWYRQHPFSYVLCWDFTSAPAYAVAAPLLARGFEQNWRPHWMRLDLSRMTPERAPDVEGVEIILDAPVEFVAHIPFSGSSPREARVLATLIVRRSKRVWTLEAQRDGRTVGRCVLNLTIGDLGVAGLFSMGVLPDERGRGIGGSLVRAAAELALRLGARHVVLNATALGEPVYRRLGFTSLGYGATWLLRPESLAAPRPTDDQIALAEAVCRGDGATLDDIRKRGVGVELDAPLPSGMTLIEAAVLLKRLASANWLDTHGATLDLLSAWDLGWRDRVLTLLAVDPALANAQRGPDRLTPLHIAVDRDDADLARTLLAANPDLTLEDALYHSTALDWARHLRRAEIAALLEAHQARLTTLRIATPRE